MNKVNENFTGVYIKMLIKVSISGVTERCHNYGATPLKQNVLDLSGFHHLIPRLSPLQLLCPHHCLLPFSLTFHILHLSFSPFSPLFVCV